MLQLPGRLPGLYLIRRDAPGERSFHYWRGQASARELFALPGTPSTIEASTGYDLLYFSGITLSLYGEAGRERLFEALERTHARGGRVAFDTNFRPAAGSSEQSRRPLIVGLWLRRFCAGLDGGPGAAVR